MKRPWLFTMFLKASRRKTLPNSWNRVPDRNRILVHRVFRAHQRVQRATALSFRLGRGSYALRGCIRYSCIRYSCIYIARMSPTLSGSSALQHVKLGDALEIRNGIIFDFYSGLLCCECTSQLHRPLAAYGPECKQGSKRLHEKQI